MITMYFLNKNPNFCFWFFITCIPVCILIGLSINNGWFKEESITSKYLYYWENDSVKNYIISSSQAKHPKMDYQILAHYYCPQFYFSEDLSSNLVIHMDGILKVEVLAYKEDSVFAKIRYKYLEVNGSVNEVIHYVPCFLLHDTVPQGYQTYNEQYMHD